MSLRKDASFWVRRAWLPQHRSRAAKVPSFRAHAARSSTPLSDATLKRVLTYGVSEATVTSDASAKVIDGKYVSKLIRDEISAEVSILKEAVRVVPGLVVILVGDRKDSVRNKKKACESVGINSFEAHLPAHSKEEEVLLFVSGFNDDPSVHGILVQLPLPSVCPNANSSCFRPNLSM